DAAGLGRRRAAAAAHQAVVPGRLGSAVAGAAAHIAGFLRTALPAETETTEQPATPDGVGICIYLLPGAPSPTPRLRAGFFRGRDDRRAVPPVEWSELWGPVVRVTASRLPGMSTPSQSARTLPNAGAASLSSPRKLSPQGVNRSLPARLGRGSCVWSVGDLLLGTTPYFALPPYPWSTSLPGMRGPTCGSLARLGDNRRQLDGGGDESIKHGPYATVPVPHFFAFAQVCDRYVVLEFSLGFLTSWLFLSCDWKRGTLDAQR
ncbi:hypothetical protein THAOC_17788, partial [Thalassiosira oceanica]